MKIFFMNGQNPLLYLKNGLYAATITLLLTNKNQHKSAFFF